MKSMVCLFVFALVAAAQAHPGGLTGIPWGGVPIASGAQWGGLGWGGIELAPKIQPISPAVIRNAQPIHTVLEPVKTIVSAPVLLGGKLGGW